MKKSALVIAMAMISGAAAATTELPIEVVEVVGDTNMSDEQRLHSQSTLSKPVQDAGELLRSVNGMTATRRGGRGFEPIIRGQSQNQLNVLTDGAYTFGACPGRMDPPTVYTAMDNFDQLTIIKGNRSVIYGSGGSGGTLLFEHKRPDFSEKSVLGSLNIGHTTNSQLSDAAANFAFGNTHAFMRIFGDMKTGENYDDGAGVETSSAFDSASNGVITGGDLNDHHYLQLSHEIVKEDNAWFPGNGMDSPWTDSATTRLKWRYTGGTVIDELEVTAYQSNVDHLMDNYSLRNRMPMNNMGMVANSTSNTRGGRVLATLDQDTTTWRVGLDHRATDRDSTLHMDMGKDGSYDMLASLMWPGVEQSQIGLFAEADYSLNSHNLLRVGARVDQFESEATKANTMVGMMGAATPNTLYQNAYDVQASKQTDTGLGLVFGWDHTLSDSLVISTNLSRSIRAADASEQFIARSAMGRTWVGNPEIEAETHHQLDLTLVSQGENNRWSATLFWDEISDYIQRYNLESATLYRNVDATLYGFEMDTQHNWNDNWSGKAAVSYTRGESDNGDLGQIAPLEARFNLDYSRTTWALGAELIAAAEQDAFDPNIDAGASEGFTLINLYSRWQISQSLRLQAGIENLLDETYAYHVNAANSDPFNPDPVRVNEPGQQIWVKARYSF